MKYDIIYFVFHYIMKYVIIYFAFHYTEVNDIY